MRSHWTNCHIASKWTQARESERETITTTRNNERNERAVHVGMAQTILAEE